MLERNLKKFAKMKTKSFFLLVGLIVVSSALIWLFNIPTPHLKSFVSKTQLHIKNINSQLQVLEPERSKELEVDSTYLELLGFVKDPKLFNEKNGLNETSKVIKQTDLLENDLIKSQLKTNSNMPPLVTAFSRFTFKEKELIESKLKYFFDELIIIYDLDLSSSEQLKIKKLCNSSCSLKTFKGDKYPHHLVDQKMKAYKPIIIQEILNEFGAIIWIEPPNVFTSNKIEKFLNKSRVNGLLAWPLSQPVTQMTHPLMFKYFQTKQNDFYFVHMLDTSQFILYNNKEVHEKLMLPWVKCALKEECIAPAGSKFNGCDFSRRPAFLYSGCHRYERSAFSIITAILYNFDHSKYTMMFDSNNQILSSNNSANTMLYSLSDTSLMSSFIQISFENSFMNEMISTKTISSINSINDQIKSKEKIRQS